MRVSLVHKTMIILFTYLAAYIFWQALADFQVHKNETTLIYGSTMYIVVQIEVNWLEALLMCESQSSGRLAVLKDKGAKKLFHNFLKDNLGHKNKGIWVGAKSPGEGIDYTWINTAGVYDSNENETGSVGFKSYIGNCAVFGKKNETHFYFFSADCNSRRMFICEKPIQTDLPGYLTTKEWVAVNNYSYGIFFDKKTWKESVRQCRRHHDAYLADFRNNDEVFKVGAYLLMGRPSVLHVWIGALYINDNWQYLVSGVHIPNTMNNNTKYPPWIPQKQQDHIMYPEWPTVRERGRAGCLVLDKHFSFNPGFLEKSCQMQLPYVCARKI